MTGKTKRMPTFGRRISPLRRLTLVATAALACGCGSSKLETGYTPRPLSASDTERKAYYAGKYTKAAVRAEQEREAEPPQSRLGFGAGGHRVVLSPVSGCRTEVMSAPGPGTSRRTGQPG